MPKKTLHLIARLSQQCTAAATTLSTRADELHQSLQQAMRNFGRQCRGQGKVFVKLVRIRQQCLSKRGQNFRRLFGLRSHNINQINDS
jgi:hypothetical protein